MSREPGPAHLSRRVMELLASGDITVEYRKKLRRDGMSRLGYQDPSDHRKLIQSGQSRDELRRTGIHEVLHEIEDRKVRPSATEEDIERRTHAVDNHLTKRRKGRIEFLLNMPDV